MRSIKLIVIFILHEFPILKDQIGFIDENPQNNFVQRILNHRLFFVSGGILAGTNEIQKNIIAQRGLGFPK